MLLKAVLTAWAGLSGAQAPAGGGPGRAGGGGDALSQVGGGGDQQVAELSVGLGARLDGGVAGRGEHADGLHRCGGVLGAGGALTGQRLAGGGLGVDGVVLTDAGTGVGVGPVDLDHVRARADQVAGQSRAVGAGGLHGEAADRAVGADPVPQVGVAGDGGGKGPVRQALTQAGQDHDVMSVLMRVHARDHGPDRGLRPGSGRSHS